MVSRSSPPITQIIEIVIRKSWLWRNFVTYEAPRFTEALKGSEGFLGSGFYSLNKPPPRFMPPFLRYFGTLWLSFLGLPVSKPWHHVSIVWWRDREAASQWTNSAPAARMRDWLNVHTTPSLYWTAEVEVAGGMSVGDGVGPSE